VLTLDRHAVRRRFEERFSATRMAKDYVAVYQSLLKQAEIPEPDVGRLSRLQPALEDGLN
jgi:hypothetical protein